MSATMGQNAGDRSDQGRSGSHGSIANRGRPTPINDKRHIVLLAENEQMTDIQSRRIGCLKNSDAARTGVTAPVSFACNPTLHTLPNLHPYLLSHRVLSGSKPAE